jgi:hypothetical protein
MKGNETGGTCNMHRNNENAYRSVVVKDEEKKLLWRTICS